MGSWARILIDKISLMDFHRLNGSTCPIDRLERQVLCRETCSNAAK